jgi:HSP20 family molecular chaperone IbpA
MTRPPTGKEHHVDARRRDPGTSSRERRQHIVDATHDTEALMRTQTVPVNVFETSEALVVVAPLPAVSPEDVTIELDGSNLRFWAHLRSAAPREYLVHEWDYGGYERAVELPPGYGTGVEASLGRGQLAIRVLRGPTAGQPLTVQPT